ncbi:LrgB family protein [Propionivibrio limicola]|uniref:LrgB family protein n=1 Tax=Propionivibrio limicola TaxID=167645 RepID=UPI0014787ACC|nr:LrgB family protein [Propionivibrio limicola]
MTPLPLTDIWTLLSGTPLLGLTVTLIAYLCGGWLFKRSRQHALANPVLIAIVLITLLLWATETPYPRYFESASLIHFLLGPATVALAVPLHAYWRRLRQMALPLLLALLAGSATAAFSAMIIADLLGASPETVHSLAPKSVTTPIAMGVAEQIGGIPSLTAVLVILTGILGAVGFPAFFRLLRIRSHAAQGFAVGLASHGLGTARAFLVSEEMGAFSALAMGLNGILTAVFLPLLLHR